MIARILATLAVFTTLGNAPLFAQQDESPKVGETIVIQMTGDLAVEYGKRTGLIKSDQVPPGLQVETTATIEQKLNDGRVRIEHASNIVRDSKPGLVTLTATIDSTKLTTDVTPKGTKVYASPADQKNGTKPMVTTAETKTRRLLLSELKGLRLRTWKLAEELGD